MVSIQGNKATGSEIITIIAFIAGLIIVFYVLIKQEIGGLFKDTSKTISDVINAPGKYVSETNIDVSTAAKQAPQAYEKYVTGLPLFQRIAVQTGTVVSDTIEKVVGVDVVESAAEIGYQTGSSINIARGTLKTEDLSAYNTLSEAQRLAYNVWAADIYRRMDFPVNMFHYAPAPSAWLLSDGYKISTKTTLFEQVLNTDLFKLFG